jgi:ParB/RepB/Spo0J family partition protein
LPLLSPKAPSTQLPPPGAALRLRVAGSLRSRFSPSNPTAHAAPGSSEVLLRGNERERAMTTNTVTTTTTDISLAKLIPCPANVRRTGASSGIDALAASIQAHGLLQSLVVRPKLDSKGQTSDRYEVVAGGRRLAALKLLAKQKRITNGTAIPCRVLDTDGVDGAEASLAENIVRQDMHPADQFEAFHGLHKGRIGIEDIAARFGVSAHTVRQRLRLASISLP